MKSVLVLNSPLLTEQSVINQEDYLPPLGLGIVASSLEQHNQVVFIDLIAENYSVPMVLEKIAEAKPDIVCTNIFTTNYMIVKSIVEGDNTNHRWIIGGLPTKGFYKDIFTWKTENPIDIVCGDGELVVVDIVDNKVSEPPVDMCGNRRYYLVNIDSPYYVKTLDEEILNRSLFSEPYLNVNGEQEVSIYASRGCPNNCAFCGAARSRNVDMGIRRKSEAKIRGELHYIKKSYWNVACIRVLDDLFLLNQNSMLSAARIFREFDYRWRAMCHIKSLADVNENTLKELVDSGCKELFIGIESGSPRILQKLHKTDDLAVIKESLTKLFDAGIDVKGYFVCGVPSETEADLQATYDLALSIKSISALKGANFRASSFQFRPYCATELYDEIINQTQEDYFSILHKTIKSKENQGKSTFNFSSGNYSCVSDELLTHYISKLNEIK